MTVEKKGYRFVYRLRARYAETDMQGVVFYGNYLVYYDTAITEYLRWLGWDYQGYVAASGNDFHVVKVTAEYLGPATFDDWIEIGIRTARLGRSSIAFDLAAFVSASDDRLVNRGEVIWVNTNQASHQSAPMDPALVDAVAAKDPVG